MCLWKYVASKAKYYKTVITLNALDETVGKRCLINMKDTNAKLQMENLFFFYYGLLCRYGLEWIISENQTFTVSLVLSTIRSI